MEDLASRYSGSSYSGELRIERVERDQTPADRLAIYPNQPREQGPLRVAPLQDCDGKPVTREHYISKALLLRFGDGFWVDGLSWMSGPKQLTEKVLVSKMLCKKHNNALDELDTMIGNFYDVLVRAHEDRLVGWHSFEGSLLERWAIKVMCGLIASGNFGDGEAAEIVLPYLQILFGQTSILDGRGFYCVGDPIERFDSDRMDAALMFVEPNDVDAGKVYGS